MKEANIVQVFSARENADRLRKVNDQKFIEVEYETGIFAKESS